MLKMCRTVIQNVCVQKDKAVNKTLDCFILKYANVTEYKNYQKLA